ncbi:MAG: RagB/SusD family nutrient uptake outer membrane protein [Parabacteroides sp.]|nr:RagB/SusD family nutrient uptake outer membrane protein [Parabacteroides sp.]
MKKQMILSWVLALAVLAGCYDLDRAPFDQPSSSTFWKTEDQCKQGLMGVYAALKNTDLYGKMFMIDVNSDVAAGYDQYEALQFGTCMPRTGFLNGKWQNGYNAIQRANLAIRSIGEAPIGETAKNQMVGEAKFLRGLIYFHLLDYFGGLPLYDETTDLEKDFNDLMLPRSTAEETRAFIIRDLTDALSAGLPKAWPADNYGRVTLGAVYALLGKVYLYNKDYKQAIASFEEVIKPEYGYRLHDDYAGLFDLTGHTSPEMIFSIVNLGGVGNNYGMPLCFYAGTRNSYGSCWNNTVPSANLADMYEYTDGRPFDWEEVFPSYTTDNKVRERVYRVTMDDEGKNVVNMPAEAETVKALYARRDPRLSATVIAPYTTYLGWYSNAPKQMTFLLAKNTKGDVIALNESNGYMRNNKGGWETYFWRKFVPEGDWDGAITNREHTPVNFPVIRLADVYLMLAEAYNEDGNQTKAVEYINLVRARVNMPGINSGPVYLEARTKDAVFDRIFRERAFELAGEGIRDSDLRRWGLSELLLNRVEYGITGKTMFTRKFNKDRDYLWPVPASEIEINPDLKQNPGW